MSRYIRAACEKAELDDITFHTLRHTAASNWLRSGVQIKYIAEQLGHSVLICERHYAHLGPDHRAEVFATLPPSSIAGMEAFQLIKAYEKVSSHRSTGVRVAFPESSEGNEK